MSRYLVTVDAIPHCDAAFLQRLAMETGRQAVLWEKELALPTLARGLLTAETLEEANALASRLSVVGLRCGVLSVQSAQSGMRAPEMAQVELRGGELWLMAMSGAELALQAKDVTLIATGQQLVHGAAQRFIVIGFSPEPGAIVLRVPGADLSPIGTTFDESVAALARFAPGARVERGLDASPPPMELLPELGSADRAHAATLSAFISRRATPPVAATSGGDAAPAFSLTGPAAPGGKPATVAEVSSSTARKKPRRLGPILPFAAAAALLLLVAVVLAIPPTAPLQATRDLAVGETWRSPYGVSFTLRNTKDPSIDMVSRAHVALDVRKGGDLRTVEITRTPVAQHEVFGVPFRVTRPATRAVVRSVRIEAFKPGDPATPP